MTHRGSNEPRPQTTTRPPREPGRRPGRAAAIAEAGPLGCAAAIPPCFGGGGGGGTLTGHGRLGRRQR
eukprot:11168267-Lingulodinium_polyedra.AAC.1